MEESVNKHMKTVFTIIDRGQGRSLWVRVGVGFTNRDGSLNLKLDAMPVNGTLHVREWEPGERRGETNELPVRARLPPAHHDNPFDSVV